MAAFHAGGPEPCAPSLAGSGPARSTYGTDWRRWPERCAEMSAGRPQRSLRLQAIAARSLGGLPGSGRTALLHWIRAATAVSAALMGAGRPSRKVLICGDG